MQQLSTSGDPTIRNVSALASAQILFHCTQSMAIATTPLAAHTLLGADKTLATLPIVLTHVGLMATTMPAALLMARVGRKLGFTLGATIGIVGAVISFWSIFALSFWGLCLGGFLQGAAGAFAWHYRFAATDTASAAFKPKALSLVMAGGVIAGIIGPQTAKWAVGMFDPVLFAGVYLMTGVFTLGMLALVQFVDIPAPKPRVSGEATDTGRSLRLIAREPVFITAVAASMFGFAVMTLVMSATPLAMLACGFGFNDSATVIQFHVIAMFLPSFFTGSLIQRYGHHKVIAWGAIISMGCALVNFTGITFAHFLIANVLVGLGWNFCYVGGSSMLASAYTGNEKEKVQGAHDFLVYTTTAIAAGLSGFLQAQAGWITINAVSLPMLLTILAVLYWSGRQSRAARNTPAE